MTIPHEGHIDRNHTQTQSKTSLKLNVYAPKTEIFINSFFPPSTIEDWNILSTETATAPTVAIFKSKMHYMFD